MQEQKKPNSPPAYLLVTFMRKTIFKQKVLNFSSWIQPNSSNLSLFDFILSAQTTRHINFQRIKLKSFFNVKKGLVFQISPGGGITPTITNHLFPLAPMSFSWRGSYKPCASGMASKPLYCDLHGAADGVFGKFRGWGVSPIFVVVFFGRGNEAKRCWQKKELEFW